MLQYVHKNFMIYLQKHYNESRELDSISRVRGDINELKDIMVKNIGELATCLIIYFNSIILNVTYILFVNSFLHINFN